MDSACPVPVLGSKRFSALRLEAIYQRDPWGRELPKRHRPSVLAGRTVERLPRRTECMSNGRSSNDYDGGALW